MTSTRQLAAIMFTDIVGYTALMGENSAKALEMLLRSRSIQKPQVEKHNGKWIKEIGDGALVQFNSALDAVNCAVEIQEKARASFDSKFRIGIHLGDITIENDDVYGNGVNIASRLESICDPGGIYISDAIWNAIQGQTNIQIKELGQKSLKNVKYPVRTYALQGDGLPIPSKESIKQLSGWSKSSLVLLLAPILFSIGALAWYFIVYQPAFQGNVINSLAVLPFEDLTGNEDQSIYLEGMHWALINELGQIKDIRVISKTSTLHYRGSDLTVPEIAEQLGLMGL